MWTCGGAGPVAGHWFPGVLQYPSPGSAPIGKKRYVQIRPGICNKSDIIGIGTRWNRVGGGSSPHPCVLQQEAHGPHRSPEKTVQINKHI